MMFRLQSAAAALLCGFLATPLLASAQAAPDPTADQPRGVVLDRVVAVVNNQAILLSDVDDEIRLSALDPSEKSTEPESRQRALDRLISRALIEQQIRQEDARADVPTQEEIDARIAEIRHDLPACVRMDCNTDAGWNAFLSAHQLTLARVHRYLSNRMEILHFIEGRFRQGNFVTPQEVETYYHDTLVPQYAPGTQIPPLSEVSTRIGEILLQQKVNALFDDWLKNLRSQGDIEVLDSSLESPQSGTNVVPDPASNPVSSGGLE
jgi:peptidyl-prolyl cis-trans isomerase SurA